MSSAPHDSVQLERDLAQASLRFWLGLEPSLDVAALLAAHGLEEPDRLVDDPEQPAPLRTLCATARFLTEATRSLAAVVLQGRGGPLGQETLLLELEQTSSESHVEAMAGALHDARVVALRDPQAQARGSARSLVPNPSPEVESVLGDAEARELARLVVVERTRRHRLGRAVQSRSPLPVEAWRGELRSLLDAVLAPVSSSLGLSLHGSARGVPVLAARHPGRPGRWVLHLRPSSSRSVARALALRCGEVAARAHDQPPALLASVFAARLASPSLWRGAGVSSSSARDTARLFGQDLVRWVLRLHAYGTAGDDDARAWAGCAAELLRERDDVVGALLWRGPLPDPTGWPTLRQGVDLRQVVAQVLQGLRVEQQLCEEIGEDWQRAPEAAEVLMDQLHKESVPGSAASLWRLLQV